MKMFSHYHIRRDLKLLLGLNILESFMTGRSKYVGCACNLGTSLNSPATSVAFSSIMLESARLKNKIEGRLNAGFVSTQ